MNELPHGSELHDKVEALGPVVRAFLVTILHLSGDMRAVRIGELWADERTRTFAELLIDLEVNDLTRAEVLAELRRSLR